VDLRKAAKDATEHLISLGYNDIGTWGRPKDYPLDREKLAGYREAFQAHGLPVPSSCYTYEEHGDLETIVRPLFASGRHPKAWFGMSDAHLMRLVRIIGEFSLRIPEDIALVGMDDIESSKFFTPPLTSVRIPFRQAGSSSVDALLRLIEDPEEISVRIVLRHSLVVRESCGAFARAR
jgi:LacI family transcriptional regulator, repressor for deo operon, udp, cdd, tsx, nupC, and nupG